MDAGRCVEFGTPYELLTTEGGPKVFYGMVKQTGKSTFNTLLKIAEEVRTMVVVLHVELQLIFPFFYLFYSLTIRN